MNILIRNLSRGVTERELTQLFVAFGRIKSLNIVTDDATGKSKGFGFVEMSAESEGAAAIKALDGKLVQGQKIRVKTTNQLSIGRSNKPERPGPARTKDKARTIDKNQKDAKSGKRQGTYR